MPKANKATKIEETLTPSIYCVKCKSKTENADGTAKFTTSVNGRNMIKVNCAECGTKKADSFQRMIKSD